MVLSLFIAFAALSGSPASAALPGAMVLQDALNELEVCRAAKPEDCWSPKRAYAVHGATCEPIAPDAGRPAIACRIDMTLAYEDPKRGATRYHDWCGRFAQNAAKRWEVLQVRDRVCEIASRLSADPNPLPDRQQVESALIGMMTCHDHDGMTECRPQPRSATVQSLRCRPIAPSAEAKTRVACRVTADIQSAMRSSIGRLRNDCLRLDRITPADQSPALWVWAFVSPETRCEVD